MMLADLPFGTMALAAFGVSFFFFTVKCAALVGHYLDRRLELEDRKVRAFEHFIVQRHEELILQRQRMNGNG